MRVVSMSIMTAGRYLTYIVMLLLAIFISQYFLVKLVIFGLNIFIFYLLFASIPLILNWSRHLYSDILKSIVYSIVISIITFTIVYYREGVVENGRIIYSFSDSLYLSISMFTNLGYGSIIPSKEIQLLTSLESLIGLLFIPTIGTYLWLYVQDRLWEKPHDTNQTFEDISTADSVDGVFLAIETDEQRNNRFSRFRLNPCLKCNESKLEFLKYYDILGLTAPFPKFLVKCQCGNISKVKSNTYLATWDWNKRNRLRKV